MYILFLGTLCKKNILIIICSVLTRSNFSLGIVNYTEGGYVHQQTELKNLNKTVLISLHFTDLDILYSLFTNMNI